MIKCPTGKEEKMADGLINGRTAGAGYVYDRSYIEAKNAEVKTTPVVKPEEKKDEAKKGEHSTYELVDPKSKLLASCALWQIL